MTKDNYGTSIYSVNRVSGKTYYISLQNEQYPRQLGVYNKDGTFTMKRDREKHLFLKTNSYGFNEHLIRNILEPDTEIIIIEKGTRRRLYTTPLEILENGEHLFFLEKGFEKQLFLKLSKFRDTMI